MNAKRMKLMFDQSSAERHDFDREFASRAQLGNDFIIANKNDEFFCRSSDDFFTNQSPAIPFDQIKVGVNFISTINGTRNISNCFLECNKRNIQRTSKGS